MSSETHSVKSPDKLCDQSSSKSFDMSSKPSADHCEVTDSFDGHLHETSDQDWYSESDEYDDIYDGRDSTWRTKLQWHFLNAPRNLRDNIRWNWLPSARRNLRYKLDLARNDLWYRREIFKDETHYALFDAKMKLWEGRSNIKSKGRHVLFEAKMKLWDVEDKIWHIRHKIVIAKYCVSNAVDKYIHGKKKELETR